MRRPHASMDACCLRTNADNRLPLPPLGPFERTESVTKGRDGADVCPQSSVPHPLDDFPQLGTIGLNNEVDRQTVGRPRLGRSDGGHQRSSGSNKARGALPNVPADEIEYQIDTTDLFDGVVLEVDELIRSEVEYLLTVSGASGADDIG